MGLTTWKNSPNGRILKSDISIAKNYLSEKQIKQLERTVSGYFDYIEDLVERENTFTMEEFAQSINKFLEFRKVEISKKMEVFLMRRTNGTGTLVKLKGNRRKPWFAKVTVGYKDDGQAIQKAICNGNGEKYFEKREDAEETLVWWNKNHNNLCIDKLDYTFKQLFDEWKEIFIPTKEERKIMAKTHETIKGKLKVSNSRGLLAAAKKFEPLYDKRYSSIKRNDFQKIIYETDGGKTKIVDMRNLIIKLDEYALGEDIIAKGYGTLLDVKYKTTESKRMPYTYEMIEKIWEHEGELVADIQLILLYTGMRIEELLFLDIASINIEQKYWICGLKTEAGRNRLIPIHHEILPIVKNYYNINNEFLFIMDNKKRLYYDKYRDMYIEFIKSLNFDRKCTTHKTRYTFRSELDRL